MSDLRTAAALLAIPLLSLPAPAVARSARPAESSWCGTRESLHEEELAKSRYAASRRRARGFTAAGSAVPSVRRAGEIAVIEDDGRIVVEPSPFDLEGRGVRFKRKKTRFKVLNKSVSVAASVGERLALADDDSVEVEFPSGFRFKFFGEIYDSVFVNSDGNLTFRTGDEASTARDLGRTLNGPPRISPLFVDLDPSMAAAAGGVFVSFAGGKARITWLDVPEFGTSNRNTVQVTLFSKGHINVGFGDVDAQSAIVGVSPGRGGGVELLDLSADLPTVSGANSAVGERFSLIEEVDETALASTFFDAFADDYDHLIVFADFPIDIGTGVVAWELTVQNEIQGIGVSRFDNSRDYGSRGRLESYVNMGRLTQFSADPDRDRFNGLSSVELLAHEAGHRWLASPLFIDGTGNTSDLLLGRQFAHWAFTVDSDGSVMEGNEIQDNGDGTFTTIKVDESYSALDLYLMGLLAPGDVPPFFYVGNSTAPQRSSAPEPGLTFTGTRFDHVVGDVIAAEGPRRPTSRDARRSFNMAFVLFSRPGESVSQASIDKVETIRQRWNEYFGEATDGLAEVDTTLKDK